VQNRPEIFSSPVAARAVGIADKNKIKAGHCSGQPVFYFELCAFIFVLT
jgi:hypothetical protein